MEKKVSSRTSLVTRPFHQKQIFFLVWPQILPFILPASLSPDHTCLLHCPPPPLLNIHLSAYTPVSLHKPEEII